jgi:hypothetical protein
MPLAYDYEMGMTTGISGEAGFFAGGPGACYAPGGERKGPGTL